MLGLLLLAAIMLLVSAYHTPSFVLTSHKKSFSTLSMAPVGSKEMLDIFMETLQEADDDNDNIHTPKIWFKNKTNNDINTADLKEDTENYHLSIKDSAPSKRILDTPDAGKKGVDKSAIQNDEIKEEKKAIPFWLDDNDDTSERDDTPLDWKKKKGKK